MTPSSLRSEPIDLESRARCARSRSSRLAASQSIWSRARVARAPAPIALQLAVTYCNTSLACGAVSAQGVRQRFQGSVSGFSGHSLRAERVLFEVARARRSLLVLRQDFWLPT